MKWVKYLIDYKPCCRKGVVRSVKDILAAELVASGIAELTEERPMREGYLDARHPRGLIPDPHLESKGHQGPVINDVIEEK